MRHAVPEIPEHLIVRLEHHAGTVGLVGLHQLLVLPQHAAIELGTLQLAVADALDLEVAAQRVHCFGTHAVQTHALLEGLAIVLGAGVDLAHHIDHFPQRDTPPEVAHLYPWTVDHHFHLLAVAHDELVDAVVQHFLQQDVDAIIEAAAIAQLADVHPRPQPNVLFPVQRPDVLLAVIRIAHRKNGWKPSVGRGFRWMRRRYGGRAVPRRT